MKQTVCVIGRMNPPTIGHCALIDRAINVANDMNMTMCLILVDGVGKQCLSLSERVTLLRSIYPLIKIVDASSAWNGLEILYVQGYQAATIICGSDRRDSYTRMLSQYWGGGDVIAIPRDNKSTLGTISSTAVRQSIIDNDYDNFKRMMMPLTNILDLWNTLRARMDIWQPQMS